MLLKAKVCVESEGGDQQLNHVDGYIGIYPKLSRTKQNGCALKAQPFCFRA